MATVLTDAGRALLTARIKGLGSEPKYVAWGTGAGTAAKGDTALFVESADEARVAGISTQETGAVSQDTYQVVGTLTVQTSPKTITNAGLFDAAVGGNLFIKGDFTGIPLNIGDSIQFTIKWQVL